jgi:uncharacterized protein (TIGR02646 family)
MRKLHRKPIRSESESVLDGLQKKVNASASPRSDLQRMWKARRAGKKRRMAFDDIQSTLKGMASGRERCMYCEDSAGTGIDHFRPKADYPQWAFQWLNYLWACAGCNSNEKRTAFPLNKAGKELLLDPTVDDPAEHMKVAPETGFFKGTTARGRKTIQVFGLNRDEKLKKGRKQAWYGLIDLVRGLRLACEKNDRALIDQQIDFARQVSFQAVVHHFVREALGDKLSFVPEDVAEIIRKTREDWSWAL